jgi:hypothetical protein
MPRPPRIVVNWLALALVGPIATNWLGLLGVALFLVSLWVITFLPAVLVHRRGESALIWVLAAFVLGPFSLAAYGISRYLNYRSTVSPAAA